MVEGNSESQENDFQNFGDEYGSCDGCDRDVHVSDLVKCPSSWDEIDEHIKQNRWFCSDCCEEIFANEGCARADYVSPRKLCALKKRGDRGHHRMMNSQME